MANLPDPQNESSPTKQDLLRLKVGDLLAEGVPYTKIALKLAKGDKKKAKMWRAKIRRWAATDARIQELIGHDTKGAMILALPSVGNAVVKRAQRGRVDAAKLVFESTGYHNPRVQHEHSGDIKISLSVPRPAAPEPVESPGKELEGPIVDAEVVED